MSHRNAAEQVMSALLFHGYEAYMVGGCVRDLLLGRTPKDYDVTTNATPEQIQSVFPNHHAVGAAFGVVVVHVGDNNIDVATYRSEKDYSDGRRPDTVKFETDVREDVKRRDFTINGLLMDVLGKVHDYVGGLDDLNSKIIRCIGNPDERLMEDYLRILRAFRFSVQLNFSLTEDFMTIAKRCKPGLQHISKERIASELEKMLTSPYPSSALAYLVYSETIEYVIPEVVAMRGCEQPPQFHKYDVFHHTMMMLNEMSKPASFTQALAVLLHDIGKPRTKGWHNERITFYGHEHVGADMAKDICGRRLKLSNAITDVVVSHVKNHMKLFQCAKMKRAKVIQLCRLPNFEELLELHRVDCLTSNGTMATYEWIKNFYDENKGSINPPKLITGDDLILMGWAEGPAIGALLKEVEELQLNQKISTKEEALAFVQQKYYELKDPIGESTLLDEDDIKTLIQLYDFASNEVESIGECARRDFDTQAKHEYDMALNVLEKARKILGL